MLFLHGFGSCKESFYYQINYFSKRYRVVALDFPDFGKSHPLTEVWGVGEYADWLCGFMQANGLQSAYVVAHSFGARVAIKAFSRQRSLCAKLLLTGGAGIVKPRSLAYSWQVKCYRLVKKVLPRFAERHFGSKEYRALSPLQKQSYKKIVNEDLRGLAANITCPTLLVYGKKDRVTPAEEEGAIFHQKIKNSRLSLMAGGHFCFSQYPAEFNAIADGFFTE